MLENSSGYKGHIPAIFYSRYFIVDRVKATSGVDGRKHVHKESGMSLDKIFCSKNNSTPCNTTVKIQQQKAPVVKLLEHQPLNHTDRETDRQGNAFLLPPQPNSQKTSRSSPCEKPLSSGRTTEVKPLLGFSRGFCRYCESSTCNTEKKKLMCLKLENQPYRLKPDRLYVRPPRAKSSFPDNNKENETEKEKIIYSWMQFFG